ncbi:hypothetical protein TKK_0018062 [Trichogramma kaykai]
MFEKSTDAKKLLCNEEFATSSKNMMIKRDLSLYDLLEVRPKEAAKLFIYEVHDHCAWNWNKLLDLYQMRRETCAIHLCEKISRRFFLDRAIDPFDELIHYRLLILYCHMILDNLNNEDLYNICLAATSPTDKDGVEDVITNVIKLCNNKRLRASEN